MVRKRNFVDFLVGGFVCLALALPFTDLFEPRPYTNVVVEQFYQQPDGTLNITVSFTKRGCTFQHLEVYGETLLTWEPLEWFDTEGERGDRPEGEHTISLAVALGDSVHERILVVTRHECDDRVVDGVLIERVLADELN